MYMTSELMAVKKNMRKSGLKYLVYRVSVNKATTIGSPYHLLNWIVSGSEIAVLF